MTCSSFSSRPAFRSPAMTATRSTNGPMTNWRNCLRRIAFCALDALTVRFWNGWKFPIRPLPPKSTRALPWLTAPAHCSAASAWSIGATASLLLVAWFGVPTIAERLTPLLPAAVERRLGSAVDIQVRGMLDPRHSGASFDCGKTATEVPGRAALEKIIRRLEVAAALPFALRAEVVRRDEANAIALPGGQVYVFRGLIDKAGNADEVAGVIAHEIGHVVHRDGTKAMLQGAGLSFLFGMLLGDFVGGGAVVIAAKTILQSSYTREAETAADAYGAGLMNKAGGDARALAVILDKIGGATEPGMTILLDHPETKARVAAINRLATTQAPSAFLDPAEWSALKQICGS